MGHHKQTTKPGFSLEVDNQASLFTNTHAGWVQRTWQEKPISTGHSTCRWQNHTSTKHQLHSFPFLLFYQLFGRAGIIWAHSRVLNKNYIVGPRVFTMLQFSKVHTSLQSHGFTYVIIVRVCYAIITRTSSHWCSSRLRKVHRIDGIRI